MAHHAKNSLICKKTGRYFWSIYFIKWHDLGLCSSPYHFKGTSVLPTKARVPYYEVILNTICDLQQLGPQEFGKGSWGNDEFLKDSFEYLIDYDSFDFLVGPTMPLTHRMAGW